MTTPHTPTYPPLRNRFRTGLRLARTVLHLAGGTLVVALVYPFVATPHRLRLKQRWSRQLLGMLGIELNIGADSAANDAPRGLVVANHISFIDIFAINALVPTAFVAKAEVRDWPLIGWLCAQTETIFIERGSRRAAQATRENLVGQLRENRLVAVFPEGTTSAGHEVLPFHGALFQSAIDAGVPVTPMSVCYTDRAGRHSSAADYVGDTSLLECLWSIARADGILVRLAVLPPISSQDCDRRHLAAHAHRAVAHGLRQLNPSR